MRAHLRTREGIRGLAQAVIVYILAAVLGVDLNWNPAALAGVALVVVLSAALFSTFSLIIACMVKTRERFMGIGQILTKPLFFASNAIYPIAMMPTWLQVVSHANPLTHEVDALRALMVSQAASSYSVTLDVGILFGITSVLIIVAGRLYPSLGT